MSDDLRHEFARFVHDQVRCVGRDVRGQAGVSLFAGLTATFGNRSAK